LEYSKASAMTQPPRRKRRESCRYVEVTRSKNKKQEILRPKITQRWRKCARMRGNFKQYIFLGVCDLQLFDIPEPNLTEFEQI
jgi:hypothetical protein